VTLFPKRSRTIKTHWFMQTILWPWYFLERYIFQWLTGNMLMTMLLHFHLVISIYQDMWMMIICDIMVIILIPFGGWFLKIKIGKITIFRFVITSGTSNVHIFNGKLNLHLTAYILMGAFIYVLFKTMWRVIL
jgi:hypothetical protein